MNQNTYVLLEVVNRKGTSEKGDYHIRKLKFADPKTYANHQLNYHENLDAKVSSLLPGTRVKLEPTLVTGYAGRDSMLLISDVTPVN